MSTDIVERLRNARFVLVLDDQTGKDVIEVDGVSRAFDCKDAADEIERLRALLQEAVEALEEVTNHHEEYEYNAMSGQYDKPKFAPAVVERARSILSKIKWQGEGGR